MHKSTIFNQLLIKVIIPVILVFIVSAYFIVDNKIDAYIENHEEKNKDLADNIHSILESQDFDLDLVDRDLTRTMREKSRYLVEDVFANTDNIETTNLDSVRDLLRVNADLVDIYVIDRKGVIVNTTFEKDLGLNTFNFGQEFKDFLIRRLEDRDFKTDKFSPENKTNILRKYSYHGTEDGKYIIELGFYSHDANEITARTTRKLNEIARREQNIIAVDLFLGAKNPIPFNNSDATIDPKHLYLFEDVLLWANQILEDKKTAPGYTDTRDTVQVENGQKVHYQYTYMPRKNTTLWGDAVIRIKSDRSKLDEIINEALIFYTPLFAAVIVILIVMILYVTRSVTNPLNRLVLKVNRISAGNLNERAEEVGTKEIYTLAQHFNKMLEELEESYNSLEQKVIERTAEISQQKEEIEAQRDQIEEQRDILAGQNKKIEQAYKDIEEQKSHIEDSIHYAKRIQTAILPSGAQLSKTIRDHFVLYKPKDIVSGDFYWSSEKNGKGVLVVADCTGHGVPGAFMSMIGNMLLNKIVNENNVVEVDEVLNRMRHEIITALNQKGNDHESKDGMDVVICTFDFENRVLEFAGANNPLFIVRKGELIVYKGNKQPVGYFIAGLKPFTKHTIQLEQGDQIYMFTDGYQDQFGGPSDRKFMTRNFKTLLTEISTEASSDQKEILNNTIENWMVNTRQIDDILIIGLKIN